MAIGYQGTVGEGKRGSGRPEEKVDNGGGKITFIYLREGRLFRG